MIFWGPPGTGKTTLARIIAQKTKACFVKFSAVAASINDVRKAIIQTEERLKFKKQRTILFIDEIHRFNKAQQDALLPAVEEGTVILIGATTENPSFEVISPLLSRFAVYILKPLSSQAIEKILSKIVSALILWHDGSCPKPLSFFGKTRVDTIFPIFLERACLSGVILNWTKCKKNVKLREYSIKELSSF